MKKIKLGALGADRNVNLETVKRVLTLVVAGLIILGGYYVWHVNRTGNDTTGTGPTAASPKAVAQSTRDWKSYTLAHDKLTFKYPPSWHVSATNVPKQNIDFVQLDGPGGFVVVLQNGVTRPSGATQPILATEPISVAGQNYYLAYLGTSSSSAKVVQGAVVVGDPTDEWSRPTDKNAVGAKGGKNMNIVMQYASPKQLTANDAKNDPAYVQAKLIIRSMSY